MSTIASFSRRPPLPGASETSPQTRWLIDEEVRRIVDDAHDEVTQLLSGHRGQLDNLTHALLQGETLDGPDAYASAGVPIHTSELVATSVEPRPV